MKKLPLILFVMMISCKGFSQYDSTAPYFKDKVLPNLNLLTADSVFFTEKVLEEKKSTIIMLFNPDCEHCQKQTDVLLLMPELPKLAQVVMISVESLQMNKIFYQKNHLEKYPFIHLGRDFKFFCISYFKPTTVPVLIFYNKKNELIAVKKGNATKEDILDILK